MSPTESPAVPVEETWNLADLFPDEGAFQASKEAARGRIPRMEDWRGRLAQGGDVLAAALDDICGVARELQRLLAYASMLSDADTRIASNQALRQEVELLFTEFGKRTAWLRPEILEIPSARLGSFLETTPALAPHAHFLKDLDRQRVHILTPPEERILAEAGLLLHASDTLFGVFQNAEMPFPGVTFRDGTEVRLSPAAFAQHRTRSDRADRERLFEAYYGAYAAFRGTLGQNLYEGIKAHVFRARVRRYPSCLAAALDADNVPVAVYHNLLSQMREALPVLHRYFRLRARALGVEPLAYHDLYCPIVSGPVRRYTVEDARRAVREAMQPLGPEYGDALGRALTGRWIDWHPGPGKRAGAYASGSAYDVHPYMLLNFHGDYESVSTLAHEAGHALHSYFSNRTQPYPTADYSIFVAEVASTFNEALLQESLLARAVERQERLFLLAGQLDGLRATLFRQSMFAEFELAIHEAAEGGEPLTGELLSGRYLALARAYHGHERGICRVDDRMSVEWAVVPHFHYNFYVYQYATGIVAATALSEAVLAGEPGARDRYLAFLSAGGSDDPLVLLRHAGVDLESPAPYAATLRMMDRALDRLEELLD